MTKYQALKIANDLIRDAELTSNEEIAKFLEEHPMRTNAKIGAAIRWTLWSGTFYEDLRCGYQFMMPRIYDVLCCWHGKHVPTADEFCYVPAEPSYC